jgi:hypothetical protein
MHSLFHWQKKIKEGIKLSQVISLRFKKTIKSLILDFVFSRVALPASKCQSLANRILFKNKGLKILFEQSERFIVWSVAKSRN